MKILVVLYKFGTVEEIGKELGSYDYLLNQMIYLNNSGVEITVLAPWVKWFKPGSTNIEGIKVVRYWPKLATRRWRNFLSYKLVNKLYILQTSRLVKKLSLQLAVDAIYVRQARETGYAVARVKEKLKVPIIFQPITTWRWHFEDVQDSFLKKIVKDTVSQRRYADKILKTYDHFITYDQAMIDEYVLLGADKDKFTIIPPAVKHEVFKPIGDKVAVRQELGWPVDKKIILNVSRINLKEKGQLYLLAGFKKVVDQNKDIKLVIIGPGTVEQISKLNNKIKDLKLEDFVMFLGPRTYQDLPKYMGAADIGVFPSIWFEAFGRTTIDMMSCGLPMVTTRVGGMPEANIENVTGFNVESRNVDAIAQSLIRMIENDQPRVAMSSNARQRVLDVYTFEKNIQQFKNMLEKII